MFTIYKSYNVIGHEKLDMRKFSFLKQRFCFFALIHFDSIMTIRTTPLINSIQCEMLFKTEKFKSNIFLRETFVA